MEETPDKAIYLNRGHFRVTERAFRTRSKTFLIRHMEKTQLRRPFLLVALALAAAVGGFIYSFEDLLFPHEILHLLWPSLLAIVLASRIGVLTIHSKALGRESAVVGLYDTLREVRQAIDSALEDRIEKIDRFDHSDDLLAAK